MLNIFALCIPVTSLSAEVHQTHCTNAHFLKDVWQTYDTNSMFCRTKWSVWGYLFIWIQKINRDSCRFVSLIRCRFAFPVVNPLFLLIRYFITFVAALHSFPFTRCVFSTLLFNDVCFSWSFWSAVVHIVIVFNNHNQPTHFAFSPCAAGACVCVCGCAFCARAICVWIAMKRSGRNCWG